jgi:hypothetical protein
MRLMRELEVPVTPRDRLFRASRFHAILFVLIVLGACAAVLFYRWPAARPSYFISAGALALLILCRRFITARFHPSNWLLRLSDEGMFIHFRSYLNEGMPGEDPTVMFLSFSDLRSARRVKEWIIKRNMQGGSESQILHWVEFELAIDPAPLVAALAAERSLPGASVKHWYGTSITLVQDFPVLMERPPFLRVRWQVVPRVSVLLDALPKGVTIAPPVKLSSDFASMQGLSREEQTKRLRELNARGDTIATIYLAQKIYGCDLTQATQIVKGRVGDRDSEPNLTTQ